MMEGKGNVVTGGKSMQATLAQVTPPEPVAELHRKKAELGSQKLTEGKSKMVQKKTVQIAIHANFKIRGR